MQIKKSDGSFDSFRIKVTRNCEEFYYCHKDKEMMFGIVTTGIIMHGTII
jgi:hypothetical protein